MIISFKEIRNKKGDNLRKELYQSLTDDVLINRSKKGSYEIDVKLIVDGVELDPKLLHSLISNIEEFIEDKANEIILNRMNDIEYKKMKELEDIVTEAVIKVRDSIIK